MHHLIMCKAAEVTLHAILTLEIVKIVSFKPRPLYHGRGGNLYQLNRKLGGYRPKTESESNPAAQSEPVILETPLSNFHATQQFKFKIYRTG